MIRDFLLNFTNVCVIVSFFNEITINSSLNSINLFNEFIIYSLFKNIIFLLDHLVYLNQQTILS